MNKKFNGKAIIFSAPSGAGKTTIVKKVLNAGIPLKFSVSACSRRKRDGEENGKDYHFLNVKEFKHKIERNEFIEWEEVYKNNYYGTLKSEIDRIWKSKNHVIFDVDVKGGLSLKKYFGENAISIFINPPSIKILFDRLRNRGTDNDSSLKKRMYKAKTELTYKNQFDMAITNDNLNLTVQETLKIIKSFIGAR